VVRSKNPKGLFKRFRTGYILFERDTTKSFFNFYAKSFLSGVVSTIRRGNEIRKERNKKLRLRDKLIEEGKLSEGIEIPIENEYFSN